MYAEVTESVKSLLFEPGADNRIAVIQRISDDVRMVFSDTFSPEINIEDSDSS